MPWPTWPTVLRESSSHREGGERRWAVNTLEFTGANGQVSGLRCVHVEWSPGEDGRPASFKDSRGTEFEQEAQLVLLAMGFVGPAPSPMLDELRIVRDRRGNIKAGPDHMTSVDGVFTAGDMTTGQSLVVRAMADGRDAASGIMDYLSRHP